MAHSSSYLRKKWAVIIIVDDSRLCLLSLVFVTYFYFSYSTVVEAEWTYDNMRSANFDNAWLTVKDAILDKFAGPPDVGVYSPSVQHTLYQAQKVVLEKVPEVILLLYYILIRVVFKQDFMTYGDGKINLIFLKNLIPRIK